MSKHITYADIDTGLAAVDMSLVSNLAAVSNSVWYFDDSETTLGPLNYVVVYPESCKDIFLPL